MHIRMLRAPLNECDIGKRDRPCAVTQRTPYQNTLPFSLLEDLEAS